MEAEQRLWPVAVLNQAFKDARGTDLLLLVPAERRKLEQQRSLFWLATEDFIYVCEQAGLDPGVVQARFPRTTGSITQEEVEGAIEHRYRGLSREVRDEVELTPLDRGPFLARLRKLHPEEALRKIQSAMSMWYNKRIL